MSQVTITTTIVHGNPSDKPLTNVTLTDSNHKEDLTTHRAIESGHTGNDLTTNTHNVALVNDIHNPQRTHDLNSNHPHGFDNTTYNTTTHNTNTHNTQLPDVTIHRTNDYDKTVHNPNVTSAPQTHTTTHYDNTTHNVPQTSTTTHYDKTTHNSNLVNVLPQTNTTKHDTTTTKHYDNTNVLPQSNTTTQTHTTTQPLVGAHSHSHEYDNLHGKDSRNLLTGTNNENVNIIRTNVPENLEVDHNRKDNWARPDDTNNKKIDVKDTDHHRHNNDVLIDSTDTKLKKDHDHHHHNLHDTNTKTTTTKTTEVHTHEPNKTTIIHDKNSNVYPNQNLSNDNQHIHSHDSSSHNQKPIVTTDTTSKNKETIIVDDDLKKRNLTYDTHPTFANDVGTTGLLGNNLGNNLAQDLGPDHLVPRGVNKNADWTGHVPDPNHPKHDNLENLPKDNTKKL